MIIDDKLKYGGILSRSAIGILRLNFGAYHKFYFWPFILVFQVYSGVEFRLFTFQGFLYFAA
jgi:hypothetical protein